MPKPGKDCEFCTYPMPKVVRVRLTYLKLLYRLIQLSIIGYFFIFVMWYCEAYQKLDKPLSGVMAQVIGIAVSHQRDFQYQTMQEILRQYEDNLDPRIEPRPLILDDADYKLQSIQNGALFIVTRVSTVTVQSYGICPEARDLEDAYCQSDDHCQRGRVAGSNLESAAGKLPDHWKVELDADAHGIFTGRCRLETNSCEIYGWCPIQEDLDSLHRGVLRSVNRTRQLWELIGYVHSETCRIPQIYVDRDTFPNIDIMEPLYDVLNFTIVLKNSIDFPYFNVSRFNILSWMNEAYLRTCIYNPQDPVDRYCPNFKIGQIIELAGGDKYHLLRVGGCIAITIDWNCNLDRSLDYCLPVYDFHNLNLDIMNSVADEDDDDHDHDGWPTDVAKHFYVDLNGTQIPKRILIKVNGIQFLIRVTGEARKFNWIIFSMNLGANLGLMGLASTICDFILFHLTRKRKLYAKAAITYFPPRSNSCA